MKKSWKALALVVAAGGALFQFGCLSTNVLGASGWIILSILNEEFFG